jgi:hypothetical protein
MRVLVACEYSGIVRDAFIARGHDAMSCDLLDTEIPGPHYKGDVRDLIILGRWDMMIAFPPCTYLSYAGTRHWNNPGRKELREDALDFVRYLMNAPIHRIAIENPKSCIQEEIRRSDQIINPWMFGDPYVKHTHLWLKNLPPLISTCISLERKEFVTSMSGKAEIRGKRRSKTFQGIAIAMAEQWG